MDEVKIHWALTALNQRNSIFSYWNKRNKSNTFSINLNKKNLNRLKIIQMNPLEGKDIGVGDIRESTIGAFSIYYAFRHGIVYVVSIWDNRQNPIKLLKILKG